MATATGIPVTTLWRRIRELHADGKIHVCRWIQRAGGGKHKPIYAAGPGEDAVYQLKSRAERKKEERAKKALAAPPDRSWLRPQDRKRELALADRTAKTRDPMIEALFGPARRAA